MLHDDSKPIPLSRGIPPKDGEGASRTALDRYWRIIDRAIGTAIITIDAAGIVTGWSEGARQILGWTEDEMLGRSLGCIFPEEEGGEAALRAEIAQAAASGAAGGEGWRLRKDGSRFWAIGETRPLSDGDAGPASSSCCGIARSIAKRRRSCASRRGRSRS